MKKFLLLTLILGTSSIVAAANTTANIQASQIPDLPPDATSADYQQFQDKIASADPLNSDGLDEIIATGVKNLQWLIKINAGRDENSRLSFTDANHRIGYPIEKPNRYSPAIISARYQEFLRQAPAEYRDVILSAKELPPTTPKGMKIEDYLTLGRDMDRIYQLSNRWRLMEPYMSQLERLSYVDVRGYYFLSNMADREKKLARYAHLSVGEKGQIHDWLIQMCRNPGSLDNYSCERLLTQSVAEENGSALKFFNSFLAQAKQHYDSYFQIPLGAARNDLTWEHSNPNLTVIPFQDPVTEALRKFMLNVEDEWHWGDWHLRLNFVTSEDAPQLTFTPGATPHVNAVGGNIITMDQNTPLSDWEVNWTIRHEFGHVLGFLDCYIEFYDEPNQTMIAYQLDLTNLMCSRKGNLKEIHYNEMKRVYFTAP